jgi:hypothetical protein
MNTATVTKPASIYDHFETSYRGTGPACETFVALKDDAPTWLRDAVYEAHQGTLPNDWIYAQCRAAAELIDTRLGHESWEDDADKIHEHADSEVDIYTRALYQWATDFCLSSLFAHAEEEANDFGDPSTDTVKRLSTLQYCAIQSITSTIVDAWRASLAAEDEDEDS